ncbi:multiubiquitin domain-containing protein [Bradyrhizobium sp. CCGE-LA001]|uniref:multiubiquitin domain-containing protein n=1 Tax=Bradyrhizobium sp. CCGE-LA001 TaxID=1223566 RepID=UPI0009FAF05B|nr:multiubiquitin domain-containing protein [Bradyrhizobium sp. CCGE-LA001]
MLQNQEINPHGHPHPGSFQILVAGTDLQFRPLTLTDPEPTGRQIIDAAGGRPPEEYAVLEWLADGSLERLRLDETTDLRKPGAERFIVAKSDREYRFEIDGKDQEWPEATITREVLLKLAGQDPTQFSVWQEFKNQPDKEVLAGHPANLAEKGVERFYTVMKHTTEGNHGSPSHS